MRILESAPERYDRGMWILTLGRLDRAYDELASNIRPDDVVLDLGCGTGALALRAARRGAVVKGIDVNRGMLDIAARRVREAGLEQRVRLEELGVAEIDGEGPATYNVVTSGLCFSELDDDTLEYALDHVRRVLRPGGLLLVADEVRPDSAWGRALHGLLRSPLVVLAYVLTQQTTRPVDALAARIAAAGLEVESFERQPLGSLATCVARRPLEAA